MSNRFKNLRQWSVYDLMTDQANDVNSMLYVDGVNGRVRRQLMNYGASHRQAFWNGYDSKKGDRLPPSCGQKDSIAYACYRAGQDFAKGDS